MLFSRKAISSLRIRNSSWVMSRPARMTLAPPSMISQAVGDGPTLLRATTSAPCNHDRVRSSDPASGEWPPAFGGMSIARPLEQCRSHQVCIVSSLCQLLDHPTSFPIASRPRLQCGHFLHLASSSQRLRWLDAANQVRKDLKVRSDPRDLQDLLDRLVLLDRKVPRVSKGLLGRKVPLAREAR